jgi:hypothetical protein
MPPSKRASSGGGWGWELGGGGGGVGAACGQSNAAPLQESVRHLVAAGALHQQHVRCFHACPAPARLGAFPHVDYLAGFRPLYHHHLRHDKVEKRIPQEHNMPW